MFSDPRLMELRRRLQGGGVTSGLQGPAGFAGAAGPAAAARGRVIGGPGDYLRPAQIGPRQLPQAQAPQMSTAQPQANPMTLGAGMLDQALQRLRQQMAAAQAMQAPQRAHQMAPQAMPWGGISPMAIDESLTQFRGPVPEEWAQRLGLFMGV